MFSLFKRLFLKKCSHDWDIQGSKRFCKLCGEEQWLFVKRYPSVGEPAMTWQTMRRRRRT